MKTSYPNDHTGAVNLCFEERLKRRRSIDGRERDTRNAEKKKREEKCAYTNNAYSYEICVQSNRERNYAYKCRHGYRHPPERTEKNAN